MGTTKHLINYFILSLMSCLAVWYYRRVIIKEFKLNCKAIGLNTSKIRVLKRRAKKAAKKNYPSYEERLRKELRRELNQELIHLSIKLL